MDAPGAVFVVPKMSTVSPRTRNEPRKKSPCVRLYAAPQISEQLTLVDLATLLEREGHRRIGFDGADTIDA
jgi:hypothetical protein